MAIKLFGFTLGNKDIVQTQKPEQPSFTLPTTAMDDGAVTITQNAYYGTYVDLEGAVRNELELITRYREMANHPELEMAIDDIVNEAITHDVSGRTVDIVLDKLKQSESIKKKILEEQIDNQLKNLKNNSPMKMKPPKSQENRGGRLPPVLLKNYIEKYSLPGPISERDPKMNITQSFKVMTNPSKTTYSREGGGGGFNKATSKPKSDIR